MPQTKENLCSLEWHRKAQRTLRMCIKSDHAYGSFLYRTWEDCSTIWPPFSFIPSPIISLASKSTIQACNIRAQPRKASPGRCSVLLRLACWVLVLIRVGQNLTFANDNFLSPTPPDTPLFESLSATTFPFPRLLLLCGPELLHWPQCNHPSVFNFSSACGELLARFTYLRSSRGL